MNIYSLPIKKIGRVKLSLFQEEESVMINLKNYGIEYPEEGLFIIVLGSKYCKSCKLLSKTLEFFRDKGKIVIKEIDISENAILARDLQINAIPALIFFKKGKILDKSLTLYGENLVNNGVLIGSFNKQILKEILEKIKKIHLNE